jgi:hypothetical protein
MSRAHSDAALLIQFFSNYFHQDWTLEARHPDDMVRFFMRDRCSRDQMLNLAGILDSYAVSNTDEAIEVALFDKFGCHYMPSGDGIPAKAWLQHIAHLLRSV